MVISPVDEVGVIPPVDEAGVIPPVDEVGVISPGGETWSCRRAARPGHLGGLDGPGQTRWATRCRPRHLTPESGCTLPGSGGCDAISATITSGKNQTMYR